MFQKILIANRGEIALRILRACHEMEIKVVAVHSSADSEALHVRLADESVCIGPALLKATSGGGGKGMKVAMGSADLEAALRLARTEAKANFGNDEMYMEKYLARPRHIEVQVIADTHGNVVHLGERDCSLQRRHQ